MQSDATRPQRCTRRLPAGMALAVKSKMMRSREPVARPADLLPVIDPLVLPPQLARVEKAPVYGRTCGASYLDRQSIRIPFLPSPGA